MAIFRPISLLPSGLIAVAAVAVVAGCAGMKQEAVGPARKEMAFAVTSGNQLISFNAGQPQKILAKKAITGLAPGETLVGIDFRVARGQLYGLTSSGRLLRLDTASGAIEPIGQPLGIDFGTEIIGFDFNPAVDRIRLVGTTGRNQRLHPDTGAAVDADPATSGVQPDATLVYEAGDAGAGNPPRVAAAGYTYNKTNEKITTNYAIDAGQGSLVMQGSREGAVPAVSPNSGRLTTVGRLGVPGFTRASFDIADVSNAAFLATDGPTDRESRWYGVDLASGKATFIGTIRAGEPVRGIAIEP
ncbi:MAG: DUF4394 domain-containing protein [Burkholderiaceae bacterium]